MNELVLPVTPGNLPDGFCPASYQDLLNNFSAVQSVTFPSTLGGITVSGSKPTDITRAWLQLDTLGRPIRLYYFAQGYWLSQHPLQPGHTMIWIGPLPDFTTFDGGDNGAAGPSSGPMWQQAVDAGGNLVLQAQFPIGAGTLPSGKVITNGTTGGEENHILTTQEIPPHTHEITVEPTSSDGANTTALFKGAGLQIPTDGGTVGDPASGTPPTKALPHNCMPPYYGVYFLQRTNRLFYSVA